MKSSIFCFTFVLAFISGTSIAQAQLTSRQVEMCRTLPKSAPKVNNPTHVWNVVWRNKVALCSTPQASTPQTVVTPAEQKPTTLPQAAPKNP